MNLCSFYYICEQRFYARGEREKNEENRGAVLRGRLVCPEDRTSPLAFAFRGHHRVSQSERSLCGLRDASIAGGFEVGYARASACDRHGASLAQRQRARCCVRVREALAGSGGRRRLRRFVARRRSRRLLTGFGEDAGRISPFGEERIRPGSASEEREEVPRVAANRFRRAPKPHPCLAQLLVSLLAHPFPRIFRRPNHAFGSLVF